MWMERLVGAGFMVVVVCGLCGEWRLLLVCVASGLAGVVDFAWVEVLCYLSALVRMWFVVY